MTQFKRFFAINGDIFLRTLCLIAVTTYFTAAGSAQGNMVLAANTLLMQFFIIFPTSWTDLPTLASLSADTIMVHAI